MAEPEKEKREATALETRDYLRVLRERFWIIILVVVIVLGAAAALYFTTTPLYQASSKLVYQRSNLDEALFGSQIFPNSNQERDIQTDADLVKLDQVAEGVKKQLNSPLSTGRLLGMVTSVPSATTNVIEIDAVATDPQVAADVANAFAQQFVLFRQNADRTTVAAARDLVKNQLDGLSATDASSSYGMMLKEKYESLQILESMQNGGYTLVQSAVPPSQPVSPKPVRMGILALALGLILGIGLAFLLDYLDKRIKDLKTLERCYGLPVLASVPAVGGRWKAKRNGRRSRGPVGFASNPMLLESFRGLRSSLQFFDADKTINSILISSGMPREGKTMTAVNLALSLALSGKRVIIVEADLRRPMVPEYLGVKNDVGLSTVLAGKAGLREALQLVELDAFLPTKGGEGRGEDERGQLQRDLYCLASGPLPPNPAELLGSGRMEKLIQQLGSAADFVVIDSPPVLVVADALGLAPLVDAVIVTARIRSTTRDQAEEAAKQLRRSGGRVIGVVAEGVKAKAGYYHVRDYGYIRAQT
jgi:polysaccharide biosynthesis transport protein